MTFLAQTILAAQTQVKPSPSQIIDRISQAHEGFQTGTFSVSDALFPSVPSKVFISPAKARIVMPNLRIVEVFPKQTRFYDQIFDQVADSIESKEQDPSRTLISVALIHREAIGTILDPVIRKGFLNDLKRAKWTVQKGKLVQTQKNASSVIEYDTKYRITHLKTVLGKKVLQDWTYRYDLPLVPGIPATAMATKGLPERPQLPKNLSASAVTAIQQTWSAMSRLSGVRVQQKFNNQQFSTLKTSNLITESGPNGSWKYDGITLNLQPKRKSSVALSMKSGVVLDELLKRRQEASPFARYVLNRQVPFLDLFQRAEVINVGGTITLQGRKSNLMTVTKFGAKIRFLIDPTTHRIVQLNSERLDPNGKLISGSSLSLRYIN